MEKGSTAGEAQVLQEIHHEVGIIEGNQHTTRTLHDQPFGFGKQRSLDRAEPNANPIPFCRQVRRGGLGETIRLRDFVLGFERRESAHRVAICSLARAGLNRLPVNGFERGT